LPAAVDGLAEDGTRVVVHLSTELAEGCWVIEPRRPNGRSTEPCTGELPFRRIALGEGACVELLEPHLGSDRLWVARLSLPQPTRRWLATHGRPIRYGYVDRPWPLSMYQNVYATEAGSAEMPSAGRPFTTDLVTRLVAKGVGVTPIVLHTGVASLGSDEAPYPERVAVPGYTAARVNATHDACGRVVAIGTTVVRALESAVDDDGRARALDDWTDLFITPDRGVRLVDGLLTGWHEPESSHLLMLEAVAGRALLERSYEASLAERYRWHEFGDVHLIVP
jgi:S-adenosylmethionine:tRNA ribosyltransferase-isomerase